MHAFHSRAADALIGQPAPSMPPIHVTPSWAKREQSTRPPPNTRPDASLQLAGTGAA
jgi:hypothetical protein